MGSVFSTFLRPVIRIVVGLVAIPLFRLFMRRVVRWEKLDGELTKDLEQWVRGSLLLLVATANVEFALVSALGQLIFGRADHALTAPSQSAAHLALENGDDELPTGPAPPAGAPRRSQWGWVSLGLRLLLAVGVIEAMPDQALFAIIHPGPSRLLFPKGRRIQAAREQFWPFCKGMVCRYLDRSSAVFAILSVIFGGRSYVAVGWCCYAAAIVQFLIIGLVSSRDRALDVLSEFDRQVDLRRKELLAER
jgi:hypothetical protein